MKSRSTWVSLKHYTQNSANTEGRKTAYRHAWSPTVRYKHCELPKCRGQLQWRFITIGSQDPEPGRTVSPILSGRGWNTKQPQLCSSPTDPSRRALRRFRNTRPESTIFVVQNRTGERCWWLCQDDAAEVTSRPVQSCVQNRELEKPDGNPQWRSVCCYNLGASNSPSPSLAPSGSLHIHRSALF